MTPRWTTASIGSARKMSFSFLRRMSTCSWTTSFGLSGNGRRSTPITRRSRCWTRTTCLPSRPHAPVTRMVPSPRGSAAARAIGARRHAPRRSHAGRSLRARTVAHQKKTLFLALRPRLIIDWIVAFTDEDLLLDDRVVVVGIALEPHRLAEVDAIARRQRQHAEREEKLRQDGHVRHAQQLRERVEVADRDVLLLAADHGDRDDRRARLEREAHEPEPEVDELVALVERLRDAARALREDEQRLVVLEQALGVLRHADHLPDAREEQRDERQRLRPLLDHRAHEARRLDIHEERRADERGVDRDLAGVVRDEQDAAGGHVLLAEDLGAEVLPMEERDRGERPLRPLRIETELVHAGRGEVQRDAREPLVELLAELAGHPVVDAADRRIDEPPRERSHRAESTRETRQTHQRRRCSHEPAIALSRSDGQGARSALRCGSRGLLETAVASSRIARRRLRAGEPVRP